MDFPDIAGIITAELLLLELHEAMMNYQRYLSDRVGVQLEATVPAIKFTWDICVKSHLYVSTVMWNNIGNDPRVEPMRLRNTLAALTGRPSGSLRITYGYLYVPVDDYEEVKVKSCKILELA